LIFEKVITIVATRGQILRLKSTKFHFGWGCTPDLLGDLIVLPQTCNWIIKGPTSKRKEER